MSRRIWAAYLFAAIAALGQAPSPHHLRADVRFLSSDLLEGRAPGTRGDALAAEYVRSQFAELGLPVRFQAVEYTAVETLATSRIGTLQWLTDVTGYAPNRGDDNEFQNAEVVFAGHGVVAPEFDRDDYGAEPVRGKVVVLVPGGPEAYASAESKVAEAERRGALAVLLVHAVAPGVEDWAAIQRSWGCERHYLKPADGTGLRFAGWITSRAAETVVGTPGDLLLQEAAQAAFRARRLARRLSGRIASRSRTVATRNVVAVAAGSERLQPAESVLFTAHLDHLGVATQGAGDRVYNGAIDNATGVAALLEVARLWTALEPRPLRSAVFVATAAEEPGAFGARTYAEYPELPLNGIRLHLDLHHYLPLGRTNSILLRAADQTLLWPVLRHAAGRFGVEVRTTGPTTDGAGLREFAERNVPSFTLQPGPDYTADAERKLALAAEMQRLLHHAPADEYSEDWDISGLEQAARLALEMGVAVANLPLAGQ